MTQLDHLGLVVWGIPPALLDVGFEDDALAVRRRATDLHAEGAVEDLVILLGKIGVELTKAYVRAGGYVRRAPDGIRDDALKYQADLFEAKCHVAVARAVAKRVLKGEAWGLN